MGPDIRQESSVWRIEDRSFGYVGSFVSINSRLSVCTDKSKKEYNPRPCCPNSHILS